MAPIRIKITRKHQITLTKPLRDHLGVSEGDQIEAIVGAEGEVIVRAAPTKALDPFADPFAVFDEWASPEDDEAFAHLQPSR
jgi:AbrB family looped-hinge helix DNA binding protein